MHHSTLPITTDTSLLTHLNILKIPFALPLIMTDPISMITRLQLQKLSYYYPQLTSFLNYTINRLLHLYNINKLDNDYTNLWNINKEYRLRTDYKHSTHYTHHCPPSYNHLPKIYPSPPLTSKVSIPHHWRIIIRIKRSFQGSIYSPPSSIIPLSQKNNNKKTNVTSKYLLSTHHHLCQLHLPLLN